MFGLPEGSSGLVARKRTTANGAWSDIAERSPSEIFNAVEAVRFDYDTGRAYVSVPFADNSNDLWLGVFDQFGVATGRVLFTSNYYDGRTSCVITTWDDNSGSVSPLSVMGLPRDQEHLLMAQAHADRQMWATTGVNPGGGQVGGWDPPDWSIVQDAIDTGYCEPVNHSWRHYDASDPSYGWDATVADLHVKTAMQAMKDNLTMPALNRKGSTQYVLGWIMPHGKTNDFVAAAIAQSKHLTLGRTTASVAGGTLWPSWNTTLGIWNPFPQTIAGYPSTITADALNDAYDACVGQSKAYILHSYPLYFDWTDPASPILVHLDHVAGHPDHWYVGLGHFFAYHHAARNVVIEST